MVTYLFWPQYNSWIPNFILESLLVYLKNFNKVFKFPFFIASMGLTLLDGLKGSKMNPVIMSKKPWDWIDGILEHYLTRLDQVLLNIIKFQKVEKMLRYKDYRCLRKIENLQSRTLCIMQQKSCSYLVQTLYLEVRFWCTRITPHFLH